MCCYIRSFSLAFDNDIHVMFATSVTIVQLSDPWNSIDLNWRVQQTLEKSIHTMALAPLLGI